MSSKNGHILGTLKTASGRSLSLESCKKDDGYYLKEYDIKNFPPEEGNEIEIIF